MAATAREAGVQIVTGDTKVVERGSADKLFINTAGIGLVPPGVHISAAAARPGDVVLVSGAVGDHGLAIMTQREGLRFESPLRSDCAPLQRPGGGHAGAPAPTGAARPCATPRAAAWPPRSTSWPSSRGWASRSTRSPCPCTRRCAPPASSGAGPALCGQRGQADRHRVAERERRRGAGGHARAPVGRRGGDHRPRDWPSIPAAWRCAPCWARAACWTCWRASNCRASADGRS